MSDAIPNDSTAQDERELDLTERSVSWPQAIQPQDERQREEFRREYQLQLERRSCPSCGEEPFA